MSLLARWDIRQEGYADGASITTLTDQANAFDLNNNAGASGGFPTYSSAENAINFNTGTNRAIGLESSTLADVLAGTSWSMFALVKQASFGTNFIGGFGYSGDADQGVLIRDDATGLVNGFYRDTVNTTDSQNSTGGRSTGTWYVTHIVRSGSTFYVGYEGANEGSQAIDSSVETNDFDRFCLGAYWRNTLGTFWTTGYMREFRIYNSDERANYSAIVTEMQTGTALPGSLIRRRAGMTGGMGNLSGNLG
jgi:hypothetical protein